MQTYGPILAKTSSVSVKLLSSTNNGAETNWYKISQANDGSNKT